MMNIFLAGLSGLGLALIAPKVNFSWLVWIAFLPLLFAINRAQNQRKAALYGFITGLIFYGATFAFLFSLTDYVGLLILFGWSGFVFFYSLYAALFGLILKRYQLPSFPFLLAPFVWVLVEWLRFLGPFGMVPSLGYSQWTHPMLAQIASVTGVTGVTFLIVLVNALLAEIFFIPRSLWQKTWLAAILFFCVGGVSLYGYYELNFNKLVLGKELSLALIQGNFDQGEKMEIANLPRIKDTYLKLTQESMQASPEAVIWPETAIPFYIQDDYTFYDELRKIAQAGRINLIFGLPRYNRGLAYNSTMFISSSGDFLGWQDKHRLIPFGEYIPFRSLIVPLFKSIKALKYTIFLQQDFSQSYQVETVSTPVGIIGVGICSDVLFSDIFRDFEDKGVDYFITINNLAWYKRTSALEKQLTNVTFRAIEFRRYIAQATNNGITCIIDPWGRVVASLKTDEKDVLYGKIYKVNGRTFYSRFGDLFTDAVILVFLGYVLSRFRKRQPKIVAA